MNKLFDIFWRFLYLGCISFGGPAAHLGYFQRYFVVKHQWVAMPEYARFVALSQFLPGPGSSQVGFALGYHQAGLAGAIAAFIGFTLPSFILLYCLAVLGTNYANSTTIVGLIYGLKLLAVVVVSDAVLTMAKSFCQHLYTKAIAIFTLLGMLLLSGLLNQLLLLLTAGMIAVLFFSKSQPEPQTKIMSKSSGLAIAYLPLAIFISLFILTFFPRFNFFSELFNDFYQAGSLVFGGGHVVLPLLQQSISNEISPETFLTGYASAQAVPGPMFTMATFLGASLSGENPLVGALVATLAIFLPGFLLMLTFQKAWQQLAFKPRVVAFVGGVNAAVVGLLAAALYQPVITSAIHGYLDVIFVLLGLLLLKVYRLPILALVTSYAALGVLVTI